MTPLDIALGVEYARPLLQLFCEAFVRLIEFSNETKDIMFADLLEKDKLVSELYTYLNSERPCKVNSGIYYIRRGLLLLDICSDHKIIYICKNIDYRGIYVLCDFFKVDFTSGVLSVTGDLDTSSLNYVEYHIRKDLLCIKSFILQL